MCCIIRQRRKHRVGFTPKPQLVSHGNQFPVPFVFISGSEDQDLGPVSGVCVQPLTLPQLAVLFLTPIHGDTLSWAEYLALFTFCLFVCWKFFFLFTFFYDGRLA